MSRPEVSTLPDIKIPPELQLMMRVAFTRVKGWVGCGNTRDDHNEHVCAACSADLERVRSEGAKQTEAFTTLCRLAGVPAAVRVRSV